jgi:phosphatidylethanolamine/phosphatidyl-N-methylethanolamine N-methyltransferase
MVEDNACVLQTYRRLASTYDALFGQILQRGRAAAVRRLDLVPGDAVLEVGVGTALGVSLYPDDCAVTGIDLSPPMLARAARRIAASDLRNVRLIEMDAAALAFPDGTFDAVCAPYLMSVVPNPVRVVREMYRVCRSGGRVVMLNHFRSSNSLLAGAERLLSPLTTAVAGFSTDLGLQDLLQAAGLQPESVEQVNTPPIWSLVVCRKTP